MGLSYRFLYHLLVKQFLILRTEIMQPSLLSTAMDPNSTERIFPSRFYDITTMS